MRTDGWKEFAACKGVDTNMFFDDYEASGTVQLAVDKLCGSCVVRTQCLDWAIEEGLEGGVFGRRYFDQNPKKKAKTLEKI
jgi:WhiB family redox-sensing transcriptional regulator